MESTITVQQTPTVLRIGTVGIIATAIAISLNGFWLKICERYLDISLQIPQALGSTEYIPLTQVRVALSTGAAGLVGIVGAFLLVKFVDSAQVWCLIVGLGIGFASLYGALTLPKQTLHQHLALAMTHAIATFIIVPAITWSISRPSTPADQ